MDIATFPEADRLYVEHPAVAAFGIENEVWVVFNGQPVDGEVIARDLAFGAIGGTFAFEPGDGSLELVGSPAASVRASVHNIRSLDAHAKAHGLGLTYSHQSPFLQGSMSESLPTSRYEALWHATWTEASAHGKSRSDWKTLGMMKQRAALHVSLSFCGVPVRADLVDERMIFLSNVIDLVGPAVARALCRKYGQPNPGHLGIWDGWAQPGRFSQYGVWHSSFQAYKTHFERLPRLVKLVESCGDPTQEKKLGKWAPDLETPLVWGDPGDESSGRWPLCRLRTQYGTAEIRLLPSWPIETLEAVVTDLVGFVRHVLSLVPRIPFGSLEDFRASREWKELSAFCFEDNVRAIPQDWNEQMWKECVFN